MCVYIRERISSPEFRGENLKFRACSYMCVHMRIIRNFESHGCKCMYICGMIKVGSMLATEGSKGSEDEHWLARARYHFRMEEYWRDRALSAERELEEMKNKKKSKGDRVSRCCT